jgi:hypothetical protein
LLPIVFSFLLCSRGPYKASQLPCLPQVLFSSFASLSPLLTSLISPLLYYLISPPFPNLSTFLLSPAFNLFSPILSSIFTFLSHAFTLPFPHPFPSFSPPPLYLYPSFPLPLPCLSPAFTLPFSFALASPFFLLSFPLFCDHYINKTASYSPNNSLLFKPFVSLNL